jgi:16S rRNA (adenine1518-N6/adenine1519-N6)-dimethyltransferase
LQSNDTVIEIGPGDGMITNKLLETGAQVISIEIDYDLLPGLIKRFSWNENFKLVHDDILQADLAAILQKYNIGSEFKVIGALPYNISKKIIAKLLQFKAQNPEFKLTKMSFILQEEVSKDYVARAPRSAFLSNYLNIFANARKLRTIPAEKFYPRPKVDGGILLVEFKDNIRSDYAEFAKFLKAAFLSPRKTLNKSIRNLTKLNSEVVQRIFNEVGVTENARAAELEPETWEKLFEKVKEVSK